MSKRKGIAVAGNIIADIVYNIDTYPEKGMLATIYDVIPAVGGCVPNTGIDLATIDKALPVSAIGIIGDDENGRFIVSKLQKAGINVDRVKISEKHPTSFCNVMSMPTGERTFFNKKGANEFFSPDDTDISSLDCEILHIGYILLLDAFDAYDEEYGTVMARFLKKVQEKGIKTSVDVVSSTCDEYGQKILPALKYCDYAIMNEIESCRIFGINAYDGEKINIKNIEETMKKMAQAGVREKIIIHSKEISFILDVKSGAFCYVPSLRIPKELIKGSVGAGDAFCAGSLYGLYMGFPDKEILEFSSAAAACNLFEANSVDGMRSKEEILKIMNTYGRMEL